MHETCNITALNKHAGIDGRRTEMRRRRVFPRQSIIVIDERVCHSAHITSRLSSAQLSSATFSEAFFVAPNRPLWPGWVGGRGHARALHSIDCFRRILEDKIPVPIPKSRNHRRAATLARKGERRRGRGAVQFRGDGGRVSRGGKLLRLHWFLASRGTESLGSGKVSLIKVRPNFSSVSANS